MKKFLVLMVVVALLATSLVGCKKNNDATKDNGEKPVITVEDQKVYLPEALFYAYNMQAQYEQQFGADVMTQPSGEGTSTVGDLVKSRTLENALQINLLAYEAGKTGVTLTDEEKKTATDKAKTYFDGIDPAVVTQYGFTLELIENVLLKYALLNKYMEAETPNVPIDEVALKAALDQAAGSDPEYASIVKYGAEASAISVRAKHILIKNTDDADAALSEDLLVAALAKAKEALARAKAGEDFSALVKEYSQDPGSLTEENAEGYIFARGEFVPEFEAAAFSMEPGQISDIVETQFGYHIIELEEKDIAPTAEQIQARKDYETNIVDQAKSIQTQAYFDEQIKVWKTKYKIVTDTELWETVVIKGQAGSTPAPETTDTTTPETSTEATTETTTETTTSK